MTNGRRELGGGASAVTTRSGFERSGRASADGVATAPKTAAPISAVRSTGTKQRYAPWLLLGESSLDGHTAQETAAATRETHSWSGRGLVAHPVFKTGRPVQPTGWKVRFLRRSVAADDRFCQRGQRGADGAELQSSNRMTISLTGSPSCCCSPTSAKPDLASTRMLATLCSATRA